MFCVLCDFVSSVRALRANNCSLMLPGTDVRCGREQKKKHRVGVREFCDLLGEKNFTGAGVGES
jgi:hypothetical protein